MIIYNYAAHGYGELVSNLNNPESKNIKICGCFNIEYEDPPVNIDEYKYQIPFFALSIRETSGDLPHSDFPFYGTGEIWMTRADNYLSMYLVFVKTGNLEMNKIVGSSISNSL